MTPWSTIPAHRPFLKDLAAGLWRDLGKDGLAEALVLLPNRRAVRGLTEALVAHAGGGGLLPPQMRALGDLEEDDFELADPDLPPAISPERRRFELAGLVAAHAHLLDAETLDAHGALAWTDALGGLIDTLAIEEAAWPESSLALAPEDLARHWAAASTFLDAVMPAWAARLEELGVMDTAARRVAVTRALAERWRGAPPAHPVIAAGSTGSTPAVAELLAAIARLPAGRVVLPGLDLSLAESAWAAIDDAHPQAAMRRLLASAGVTRADVKPWDVAAESEVAGRWRRRLINEALRPPAATSDWLTVIGDLRKEDAKCDPIAAGLEGLTLIPARAEEETAAVAAILLRQALETPGRTAALVTPDTGLARRVQARLTRWGVRPDSSVGETLAGAPAGVLAGLVARAAADPLDPVTLLAVVKHPLTRLGLAEPVLDAGRETLERHGLRIRAPRAWSEIESWLGEIEDERARARALDLLGRLRAALDPLAAPTSDTAAVRAEALVAALEALAAPAPDDLWRGFAGEALARLFAALIADSDALPDMSADAFADLFDGLAARTPLRLGGASHPRLAILGVLEARLLSPDLVILAGLEEGVWPSAAPGDPFLSRPMRQALGLPDPERRIGLSAHDFAQAAAAREVVLLTSAVRDGAPTVKSRWLWRLEALAKGAGLALPERPDVLDWARRLDAPVAAPPASLKTAPRPAPTPPVATRPLELSVTNVERWVRDPYAIYARYILRLYPLERPGAEPDARARGSAIHKAFERFALEYPGDLPAEGERIFADLLVEELGAAGISGAQLVRERALADNVAGWVMEFERRRRAGAQVFVEERGRLTFAAGDALFTVTAKADRIEARGETADVLDFKSGAPPTLRQVNAFLAPQLTLTAAILEAGGFAAVGPKAPAELAYVRIRGGLKPAEEKRIDKGAAPAMAAAALDRLKAMAIAYQDETKPYVSWAAPQFMNQYGGDYDRLARVWEWAVVGEPGDTIEGAEE